MSNGESKSFSIACFVSFSERLACSVGIFQSIPRLLSRIEIPPSASGYKEGAGSVSLALRHSCSYSHYPGRSGHCVPRLGLLSLQTLAR